MKTEELESQKWVSVNSMIKRLNHILSTRDLGAVVKMRMELKELISELENTNTEIQKR